MKTKIILLALLIFSISCEKLEYDLETRLVLKGQIVNEDNQPLNQIDVRVYGRRTAYGLQLRGNPPCLTCDTDLISVGYSNQNGDFTLIFPKADNANFYDIYVNTLASNGYRAFHTTVANADFANFEKNIQIILEQN
jgi:hypothetical protein